MNSASTWRLRRRRCWQIKVERVCEEQKDAPSWSFPPNISAGLDICDRSADSWWYRPNRQFVTSSTAKLISTSAEMSSRCRSKAVRSTSLVVERFGAQVGPLIALGIVWITLQTCRFGVYTRPSYQRALLFLNVPPVCLFLTSLLLPISVYML